MKLKPEKMLWLLVLLPALPFAVNAYLDKAHAFKDAAEGKAMEYNWLQTSQLDFAPVINQQYQAECGSCHFAFQPGLLPQRSWQKIMGELDNHFGDNAELEATLHKTILTYLIANSAEHSNYLRSRNLVDSINSNEIPMRITDTLYFKRKHNQIPEQLVKGNPATGSFSNCNTCHRHAEQGLYNEHDVLIPDKNLITSTMQ
jgi:hypothetical protein